MQIGRIEIFTDEREVNEDNIIEVVRAALPYHQTNAFKIDELLNFEAGYQPINRVKTYRPEINHMVSENLAARVSDFKRGYFWANPITLVQRGQKDSGKTRNEAEAIALLNEGYEAEGIKAKTQSLGRYVEITGLGYTFVDINSDYQEGDSLFKVDVLDPRCAFVIKSSYYVDHRPMVGVSFRIDTMGQRHVTAFTKDSRYELNEMFPKRKGEFKRDKNGNIQAIWSEKKEYRFLNPLGMIPIIEWTRSPDRTGCFEKQIEDMKNLNLLISDFTNDVDQNCQAIWHTNDVELKAEVEDESGNVKEVNVTPKSGQWVHTFTSRDGKTPFIQPLKIDYDYQGMLNNIVARRSWILEDCHVPQTNDNSGGSTGIAMEAAAGWTDAEVDANIEQQNVEPCKMLEVKVVLMAVKRNPHTPKDSPLLNLLYSDVQANMKRSRHYEMTSKINTYATGVSHGIAPQHMVRTIDLFDDPAQVIEDSKPYTDRYLESIYKTGEQGTENPNDTEGRRMTDESDNQSNSPFLENLNTDNKRA